MRRTENQLPILVVGAGTTGMTMAGELARHGARVRVVDRLAAINPYARATGIHSRTLEVFQDVGVVDEVLALGLEVRTLNQYANGWRFASLSTGVVESPFPFDIMLEQSRTEAILERWLGRLGVVVERQTELVGLAERGDWITATLRRGDGREETVDTPWLVGCDGAHSRVREVIGLPFPGEEDRHEYLIGDVVLESPLAHNEGHQFLSEQGFLFVFALPAGRSLVGGDLPAGEGTAREEPTLEELEALVAERSPVGVRVSDPRWLSHFHIHYRLSPHYGHGRVFLAGDAVHIHSPIGGQGMNTGIQDAYNLAWKLALVVRGRAPASLLDSYEQERRAVGEDVIQTTKAITDRVEAFASLSAGERERLYAHVVVPEAEQRRQAAHSEELDLDYRDSILCVDRAVGEEGPHAGSQAPDARPLLLDDRQLTLFQLVSGTRHTLLLFPDPDKALVSWQHHAELADQIARTRSDLIATSIVATGPHAIPPELAGPVSVVRDPERTLRERYAVTGDCLYLIRPDGYIGYRCTRADGRAFLEYLERVGLGSGEPLQ